MEGYCATGQSPHWAVAPLEEELTYIKFKRTVILCGPSGIAVHLKQPPQNNETY